MKIIDLEPVVEASINTNVIAITDDKWANNEVWYVGDFSQMPIGIANFDIVTMYIKAETLVIKIRG